VAEISEEPSRTQAAGNAIEVRRNTELGRRRTTKCGNQAFTTVPFVGVTLHTVEQVQIDANLLGERGDIAGP
jgi:hypothetical protein